MIKPERIRKIDPLFGTRTIKGITGRHERKTCKGCVYLMPLDPGANKYKVCHYCYITGKPRGCPAEKCTRKQTTKEGEGTHGTVSEKLPKKK